MNVLTELWVGMPLGSYTPTRGWNTSQIDAEVEGLRQIGLIEGDRLSAAGQRRRDEIEATTDAMEQPIVDAVGPGFDAIVEQLDGWSARCIDDRAFPPDAFKRAAG